MNNIDAIIFDCDGTLVDSETPENQVLVEFVAEFGLELDYEDSVRRFAGCKMADRVSGLEQDLGRPLPDSFVPELRRRNEQVFRERLQPFDGVADLLGRLTLPTCVASSGPRDKIKLSLKLTGLNHFFADRIFSAYDVEKWKPDPTLFLHAAEQMGFAAERCAVVEDSSFGIQAGLAAGMQVFAFQPNDHPADNSSQAVVFRHFSELASLLAIHQQ